MAIAGVEARFRDEASVFGDDGEGDLFTVDQVREILIKFGFSYDVEHAAAAENKTLQEWVDEFMEDAIKPTEIKTSRIVVETLQPSKYAENDPYILKVRTKANRQIKVLEYADTVMENVRKKVEDGMLEFGIDLLAIRHFVASNRTRPPRKQVIDMSGYGQELVGYFKLKGFDAQIRYYYGEYMLVFKF